MAEGDSFFRPGEPTVSKLRFYSIGIVAENKALTSNIIEVSPVEELPMIDGYLDSNSDVNEADGVDASGRNYKTKVKSSNTIQAEWLPLCEANRRTSPDVRRGAPVMIYQFGDADKYYWTTLKDDANLRKLETVIWGFSATKNESDKATSETMYFFEVSTHKKTITLHTSQANGEKWGYDVQINAQEGYLAFTDTNGNYFKLDSLAESLHLENASGSKIDITKKIATITTPDQINMNTKTGTLNFSDQLNINGGKIAVKGSEITINGSSVKVTGPSVTLSSPALAFTG